MSKRCPSCGRTKAAAEFGRNKAREDGLSFYCLSCNRARNNAWYRAKRRFEGRETRDHSWVPEGFRWCPSCQQPVAHEDYTRNRRTASGFGSWCRTCKNAASSEAYFARAHGLTKAQIAELRAQQLNRCAICGDAEPQHLDHDHDSGKTRALLCQRCNHGLGLFRDEPGLLHAAALYVTGHRQQHASESLKAACAENPDGSAGASDRR
ncbi:endonuclease domain-containing protein [Blastococcus atacamensis]|uniref:endonuclease domain-containing protein n=1 Tax=Blastococcus atacamensis TaxID=2070508 RepID=UPI000CEBADE6